MKVKLNIISRVRAVIHSTIPTIICILLPSYLKINYPINNNELYIYISVVLWALIYFSTKNLMKGCIILELRDSGVSIEWVRLFFLGKRKNILIRWESIKDFMFQPELELDYFRIRLKNNDVYRFSFKEPEFLVFYQRMQRIVATKNLSENFEIENSKNYYQRTYFRVFFFAIIIIVLGIIFLYKPHENLHINYGFLTLIGGICFSIFQFWKHRRN